MSMVIKSWHIRTKPNNGDAYVQVIARESGLLSFVLSLLGIDATTTMLVSKQGLEFERGSLSGFLRIFTPFPHVSSLIYGRFKPWKKTLSFIVLSIALGSAIMGHGTASTVFGTLLLFGGCGAALLYYFLNRELIFGYRESGGESFMITFKRSVVEGQEIDEDALKRLIQIVEALLRQDADSLPDISKGEGGNNRMSGAAPTSFKELVSGGVSQGSVLHSNAKNCKKCGASITPADAFCGSCGERCK